MVHAGLNSRFELMIFFSFLSVRCTIYSCYDTEYVNMTRSTIMSPFFSQFSDFEILIFWSRDLCQAISINNTPCLDFKAIIFASNRDICHWH